MKKVLILTVLSVFTLSALSAKESERKPFIGLDIYTGATLEILDSWSDFSSPADRLNFMVQLPTALKVGVGTDLSFRLLKHMSIGIEGGLFFFATTGEDGMTTISPLFDIPVRATVRFSAGKFALQIHGGYNFSTTFNALSVATDYTDLYHKLDIGGRIYLGAFYVEYSRLFWSADLNSLSEGSNRIGMGLNFSLF